MKFSRTRPKSSDPDQIALDFARRHRVMRSHENVDFRSNAEVFEIDSRLDREECAGQDQALVMGFEIVHVGASAMHFGSYGVACAVDELVAEPAFPDMLSRRIVDFEAANFAAGIDGCGYGFYRP